MTTRFATLPRLASGDLARPVAIAASLFVLGMIGVIGPASGYGLLLIATLLLVLGCALLAVFLFTRAFETDALRRSLGVAFTLGAWLYVFAVSALAGHYVLETAAGRMAWRWILFGPAALAAIAVLDWGLHRILVQRNVPTWERYKHVISRDGIDAGALRKTLIDEVVLHRSLYRVSAFRWVRHQLILWGFALMFAVEVVAVFIREGIPAFGLADVWRVPGHPVRLAFDFAFDFTGLMILAGCILALVYRARVNGTDDQKYTDTPSALFLLVVVLSGFMVEGMRIATSMGSGHHWASPVGLAFAHIFGGPAFASRAAAEALWLFHALAACAFIAYVPLKRLVHSCATPIGRLASSQKGMLQAKKDYALRGLLMRRTDS